VDARPLCQRRPTIRTTTPRAVIRDRGAIADRRPRALSHFPSVSRAASPGGPVGGDSGAAEQSVRLGCVPRPKCPPIAADVIAEIDDRIVLIERKNFPRGWAIPGGFVEFGETVEQAAVRETREETSLEVELRALLGVYSRPDRDPRGQTVTVVYVASGRGTPVARDDAEGIGLFVPDRPPSPLAFDHAEILADYLRFIKTGERPAPWRH
jgi:8-oxo-dGTP diphosphatase